jgi:hypothetical protein
MVQRNFSKYLQKGLPGQLARPNAPYNRDRGVAGVELKPGDGVLYNSSTNKWVKPTTVEERKLVTHIVTFDPTSFNTDIGAPTTNNISEVTYAVDSVVELLEFGSAFVLVGETVENGDAAIFNETTEKWIKYSPSAPDTGDLRKKPFVFYIDPLQTIADGGIAEVRIPTHIYSFPALGSSILTAKISIPATEIKTLRATPKELVAAPGAGKLIDFVSARLVLTAGSEVLTESADNLVIEYDDGSAIAISDVIECTGFIDQSADTITNAIPIKDAIDAEADIVNKNIVLFNNGDGEFAGNASDDAVLDVYVSYRILDLS